MYLGMVAFQLWPKWVVRLRRWVYAGLYMDEGYTHWILRLWPTRWAGAHDVQQTALSIDHPATAHAHKP